MNKMSKRLIAVLFLAMLCCLCGVGFVGCATSSTGPAASPANDSSNQQQTATKEPLSEDIVDAAYIQEHEGEFSLVDVRTTSEYNEGHIPGAVNIVYSSSPCSADSVGAEQQHLYENAGFTFDTPLVLYCKTGVRAQAAAEVLRSAGFSEIKVYQGSWTDWSSNPANPIEYGSE